MNKIKIFFKESWIYILVILIVILVKMFIVSPIRVNGDSMIDTLHNKDIMILDKISYRFNEIKRFDIVVIKEDKEYLIKRVIGLPGEKVEYKDNELYINGNKIDEDFTHKKTEDFSLGELDSETIPENEYFVLGDNRENSMDSRIIGFIPRKNILGKTTLTILPFSRFGNKY